MPVKLRNRLGRKLIAKGMKLKEKDSLVAQRLGEGLRVRGFNLMTQDARERFYGKVRIKRVGKSQRGEAGGIFYPDTGEIHLAHPTQVELLENDLNMRSFETRKDALKFLKRDVTDEALFSQIEKSLSHKQTPDGKLFFFSDREALQDMFDTLDRKRLFHELAHRDERIVGGDFHLDERNVRKRLKEELVVEYKTALKYDGISGKKLPEGHKRELKEFLDWEYDQYVDCIASNKSSFMDSDKLEEELQRLHANGEDPERITAKARKMIEQSTALRLGKQKLREQADKALENYYARIGRRLVPMMNEWERKEFDRLFEKNNKKILSKIQKKDHKNELYRDLDSLEKMHNSGFPFEEIRSRILGKPKPRPA